METNITVSGIEFLVGYEQGNEDAETGARSLEVVSIFGWLNNHKKEKLFVDCFDMAHELGFIDQIEEELLENI